MLSAWSVEGDVRAAGADEQGEAPGVGEGGGLVDLEDDLCLAEPVGVIEELVSQRPGGLGDAAVAAGENAVLVEGGDLTGLAERGGEGRHVGGGDGVAAPGGDRAGRGELGGDAVRPAPDGALLGEVSDLGGCAPAEEQKCQGRRGCRPFHVCSLAWG